MLTDGTAITLGSIGTLGRGTYLVGNGDSANLHHSAYDFNDEAIPYGISYWVTLAETALAA